MRLEYWTRTECQRSRSLLWIQWYLSSRFNSSWIACIMKLIAFARRVLFDLMATFPPSKKKKKKKKNRTTLHFLSVYRGINHGNMWHNAVGPPLGAFLAPYISRFAFLPRLGVRHRSSLSVKLSKYSQQAGLGGRLWWPGPRTCYSQWLC